ncbi:MAG: transposase [Rhodoplanes sp.]
MRRSVDRSSERERLLLRRFCRACIIAIRGYDFQEGQEIVKRSDAAGFEVLPKRWIVERTFAWISRNRRLARDFERYATTVTSFIRLAMIRIMLRRLAAANASS